VANRTLTKWIVNLINLILMMRYNRRPTTYKLFLNLKI